jgi:hypothetical protein
MAGFVEGIDGAILRRSLIRTILRMFSDAGSHFWIKWRMRGCLLLQRSIVVKTQITASSVTAIISGIAHASRTTV